MWAARAGVFGRASPCCRNGRANGVFRSSMNPANFWEKQLSTIQRIPETKTRRFDIIGTIYIDKAELAPNLVLALLHKQPFPHTCICCAQHSSLNSKPQTSNLPITFEDVIKQCTVFVNILFFKELKLPNYIFHVLISSLYGDNQYSLIFNLLITDYLFCRHSTTGLYLKLFAIYFRSLNHSNIVIMKKLRYRVFVIIHGYSRPF